jgi:hypothetical protein
MDEEIQLEDNINDPYIKNLEILIFLLDKKLLIELFNEIHLLIPMKEMIERFENSAILYRKNLKRNTATTFS